MNPGEKKKVLNPNNAQSPMKKIGYDFQFRSSAELAKQYQIKREKLANDRENRAVKQQAPLSHKRKIPMSTISNAREGQSRQRLIQSKESIQQQGNGKLPMHKSTVQLSSKEVINTSNMIEKRQGEGEKQLGIHELQNVKKVKRKSVLPTTSLDLFLQQKGTHVGGEKLPDIQPVNEARSMPSPLVDEHNIELDNFDAQEEVGDDECVRDEAMDGDCYINPGTSDKKKVRGQTKCMLIHARNLQEREEVTFDKGQAVGPTDDTKQRMVDYVKTKFIIPAEGNKWVMDGLREAWRRHKKTTKERHFDVNRSIEDVVEKPPPEIPEVQFRQLIEYWMDEDVQAISQKNSENRKKQKWRHRMGSISFARVRVALRDSKENKEDPSQSEMFIATRTKKGKQVHEDSQSAIEQPGQVRCYGRSVTKGSLIKDEEINKLQQKHNNEVSTLKEEIKEMREEIPELRQLRHSFNLLVQNNPGLNVQDIPRVVGSNQPSPVDATSGQAVRGQILPYSFGSTHGLILEKEKVCDAIGGRKSI
ncbi:uncharacterized protein LOC132630809 [Lycium barbarum]|uniref:uncharacterized protein LOC132630809 n=1 Tax=Lycium barbarum TaxID=112863 RepID=UPI00293F311A|nr:uncharacterized protein LOC132630809 [Lycium barbarum]